MLSVLSLSGFGGFGEASWQGKSAKIGQKSLPKGINIDEKNGWFLEGLVTETNVQHETFCNP